MGSVPNVVSVGDDREHAVEKAIKLLEEKDTIIILSKLQSRIGENYITKDQLMLTRKNNAS